MKQCQPVSAVANGTEEKKAREWPRVRIACVAARDIAGVVVRIVAVMGAVFGMASGARWAMLPIMSERLRAGSVIEQYALFIVLTLFAIALVAIGGLAFREFAMPPLAEWWISVKKRAAGR